jgi:7-cyano-7-deazaguanine reductase
VLYITIYPTKKIIELKSLKQYTYQLRNIVVSYERLINVVYDQLMEVYKPDRLRLVLKSNPRGGISSRLVIDSDWSARGGKETYRDWGSTDDSWEVTM